MTTWHGLLLSRCERVIYNLNKFWSKYRSFFHTHKTLFELLFTIAYFVEQTILFLLIMLFPTKAAIFAGIFPLILITTISIEKTCMESRYKQMSENLLINELETEKIINNFVELDKDNQFLRKLIKTRKNNVIKK